jgi:hypothetical protein
MVDCMSVGSANAGEKVQMRGTAQLNELSCRKREGDNKFLRNYRNLAGQLTPWDARKGAPIEQ